MIQSMTGYGKAEALLQNGKLTVELRSVNGKSADITIKSSLIPKAHELEVRKKLADELQRGTIDLFLNWEPNAVEEAQKINQPLALEYARQMKELASKLDFTSAEGDANYFLSTVLRMPDVLDNGRRDIVTEENWPLVWKAICDAVEMIKDYRFREGEALYKDVTSRIDNILAFYKEVEAFEPDRISAARERILKAAAELSLNLDQQRLEQEMVFYLEKYDINEERVRLRQHCKYFMDTIDGEPYPGKKLGFIIQEIGREINTTGSKANHAGIQKLVVKMKDELEKMREQSMNIL